MISSEKESWSNNNNKVEDHHESERTEDKNIFHVTTTKSNDAHHVYDYLRKSNITSRNNNFIRKNGKVDPKKSTATTTTSTVGASHTSLAKLPQLLATEDGDGSFSTLHEVPTTLVKFMIDDRQLPPDLGHKHPTYGTIKVGADDDDDNSMDSKRRGSFIEAIEAAAKQEHDTGSNYRDSSIEIIEAATEAKEKHDTGSSRRGSFIEAVEAAAATKQEHVTGSKHRGSFIEAVEAAAASKEEKQRKRSNDAVQTAKPTQKASGGTAAKEKMNSKNQTPKSTTRPFASREEKLRITNRTIQTSETRNSQQGEGARSNQALIGTGAGINSDSRNEKTSAYTNTVRSSFNSDVLENDNNESQPGAVAVPGIDNTRDRLGITNPTNSNTWESGPFEENNDPMENESADLVAVIVDENELKNEIRQAIFLESSQAEVISISDSDTSAKYIFRNRRCTVFVVLVVVAIIIGLSVGLVRSRKNDTAPSIIEVRSTLSPSFSPSSVPTATPLPTLETIIENGVLRCAVSESKAFIQISFCRALAAAVFGNSSRYEQVVIQLSDPYSQVANKSADLGSLISSASMDVDVFQEQSRTGFSFTSPIYFGGVGFGGIPQFVDCADRLDGFFGECNKIRICAPSQEAYDAVNEWFPPSRIRLVRREMVLKTFVDGLCNVVCGLAFEVSEEFVRRQGNYTGQYEVGETVLARASISIMTREDDRQWSDFVQWTTRALITAEQRNISRANAGEFYTTQVFGNQFQNMFVDAIEAVGNLENLYFEDPILGHVQRLRIMEVNDGSTGLIFSLPFGENIHIVGPRPLEGSAIYSILQRGFLRCGVTVTPDTDVWRDLGMNYCQALAAALFEGDATKIEFINIPSIKNSYIAIDEGQVDILSGARITLEADIKEPSTGKGFTFSLPYFYDPVLKNESYSYANSDSIGLVTRETDNPWSDFVFWMVSATFYAEEEGVTQKLFMDMPSVSLFGSKLDNMYRNAISAVGNYGEMYHRNMNIPREGRNLLNSNPYGPQFDPTFAV